MLVSTVNRLTILRVLLLDFFTLKYHRILLVFCISLSLVKFFRCFYFDVFSISGE